MVLVDAEKKNSEMALVEAEKKGSDMALVDAEKMGSEMALVGAEKKGSDMALVDAEKNLVVAVKNSEETLVVAEKSSKKALVEAEWDQLHQDLMAKLSFAPKKDPVVADEELSMRGLELTVEELDLLQQAAIDLASLKTREAADYASAAACFKAAKESSSIREPEPTKKPFSTGDPDLDLAMELQESHFGAAIIRRLFKATPSQMRAAHKTASRVLKIDEKNIGSVSADVYRQVLRSTAEGQKEVPLHDVTRVLQAFSKVENNLPKGGKVELPKEKTKVEMMKAYADNINRVAGLCGAAKSTYEVLRDYFF